jgi:hypothetical protein
LLRSILVYYDQVYLLPSKDHESNNVVYVSSSPLPSQYSLPHSDLAKSTFRKNIFQDLFFSTKVEAGVLEWVARERSSPSQSDPTLSTSRTTISSLISLLTSYSQYSTLFHQPFIKSTIDFYTAEADSLAPQLSATEFFNHCAKRIEEEVGRAREVLKRETMEEVVQATESCLLRNRTGKLAVEGELLFSPLCDEDADSIKRYRTVHGKAQRPRSVQDVPPLLSRRSTRRSPPSIQISHPSPSSSLLPLLPSH